MLYKPEQIKLLKHIKPMKHQYDVSKYCFDKANGRLDLQKSDLYSGTGVFGQVGTGKSLIGLMIGLSLSRKKILWVTPPFLKFDIYEKIKKEYFESEIPVCILEGKKPKEPFPKKIKEFPFRIEGDASLEEAKIVILSYSNLNQTYKRETGGELKYSDMISKFIDFDIVIFDESHRIKGETSKVTAAAHKIMEKDGVIGFPMTGTPAPNGLKDLWGQLKVCKIPSWPEKWNDFRNKFCQLGGFKGKEIVGYDTPNKQELMNILKVHTKSILSKDVLDDLQDKAFDIVRTTLSKSWEKRYKEFQKEKVLELEEIEVTANNILVLNLRLQALSSGFLVESKSKEDEDGEIETWGEFHLVHNFKFDFTIKYIKNLIESDPEARMILWYRFNATGEELSKQLNKNKLKHTVISGATKHKYDDIEKFKKDTSQKVILINIGIMEGYTITETYYNIYFENDFSFIKKEQTGGRNHRKGQLKRVTDIDIVVAGTIDEHIVKSLEKKKKESQEYMDKINYNKKSNEISDIYISLKKTI